MAASSVTGDLDTHHNPKYNFYFLIIQIDDDGAGNCLLLQQNSRSASNESGTDHAHCGGVDVFEPVGGSATLDHVKSSEDAIIDMTDFDVQLPAQKPNR